MVPEISKIFGTNWLLPPWTPLSNQPWAPGLRIQGQLRWLACGVAGVCSNWFVGLVVVGMMVVGCALVCSWLVVSLVCVAVGLLDWWSVGNGDEGSGVVRECVAV